MRDTVTGFAEGTWTPRRRMGDGGFPGRGELRGVMQGAMAGRAPLRGQGQAGFVGKSDHLTVDYRGYCGGVVAPPFHRSGAFWCA